MAVFTCSNILGGKYFLMQTSRDGEEWKENKKKNMCKEESLLDMALDIRSIHCIEYLMEN